MRRSSDVQRTAIDPRRSVAALRLVRLTAVVTLLFCAGRVHATDAPPGSRDEAERLIDEGRSLRLQREDAAALERFQRAYALRPTPMAQAQIALAEQALGRWAAAERDLGAALATEDPWIGQYRATLREALRAVQSHLGSIRLIDVPAGAVVLVDGAANEGIASDPGILIRAEVGTRMIGVSVAGYAPWRQAAEVVSSRETTLQVVLAPLPEQRPAAPVQAAPPKKVTPPLRIGGYSLLAVGGALALGGAAALGVSYANLNTYNYDDVRCPQPKSKTCPDVDQTIRTAANAGYATLAIGGAALAAGAVLVGVSFRRPVVARAARCGPLPAATLGISCSLVW